MINNHTSFELKKIYEDKIYGIYKDVPPSKINAKSSQGFSTSQDFAGGPEGWLVYTFDEQYNIIMYWQNFYTEHNKGFISFIPITVNLEIQNLRRYTKQGNIIELQNNFICNATVGSGFQKAEYIYTIMRM